MKDSTLREDIDEIEEAIEEFVDKVIEAYSVWWETGKERVIPKTQDLVQKIYEKFNRE
jgi:hypothetical protein